MIHNLIKGEYVMVEPSRHVGVETSRQGKKALWGAFFAFSVDLYDVYLPIMALGPALGYFEPKGLPAATALTWFYLSFATSLMGRPIGAILFGYLGDKIGRHKITIISVVGFALATFFMALLPGYKSWGMLAFATFAGLRLIDGIFLGGTYTGATPLAIESLPAKHRGRYGGIINSGTGVAFALISIITLFSLHLFPVTTGAYASIGWRIPFFVGALLAGLLVVYYVSQVAESPLWQNSIKADQPLTELLKSSNARRFGVVFLVMTGAWFVTNSTVVPLPVLLLHVYHVQAPLLTTVEIFANILLVGSFILAGSLSDRLGRKRLLLYFGLSNLFLVPILYQAVFFTAQYAPQALWVSLPLFLIVSNSVFGILTAYITERFGTNIRASGYGIGYSLAIIIPSFSSLYMASLKTWFPYPDTAIVLEILSGFFLILGALLSSEEQGRNLSDESIQPT